MQILFMLITVFMIKNVRKMCENYKINSCGNINDGCKRLEGDLSMQKIIERSKLEELKPQMNNIPHFHTVKTEKLQQQESLLMIEKYRSNEGLFYSAFYKVVFHLYSIGLLAWVK